MNMGGVTQNEHIGQTTNFRRQNSMYRMEVDALSSWELGFNRLGS